jgi:hypothetical protein
MLTSHWSHPKLMAKRSGSSGYGYAHQAKLQFVKVFEKGKAKNSCLKKIRKCYVLSAILRLLLSFESHT